MSLCNSGKRRMMETLLYPIAAVLIMSACSVASSGCTDCSGLARSSLRHVDNHGVAPQAQHQTFSLAFEMHDNSGLILKPKVAAAR